MKQVKVIVNLEGQVQVVGINKDGSESKVKYEVAQVIGLRELAVAMMKEGVRRYLATQQAQAPAVKAETNNPEQPKNKKEESNVKPQVTVKKKEYNNIPTQNKMFTNIKVADNKQYVQFMVNGQQTVFVGFASDRNQFLEKVDDVVRVTSKQDVIMRLAKYEGPDARRLTTIVKSLVPKTMAADTCSCCGANVSSRVKDYSLRHYDVVLCRDCQKTKPRKQGQEPTIESTPVTEPAASVASGRVCAKCLTHEALPWDDFCEVCTHESETAVDLCEICDQERALKYNYDLNGHVCDECANRYYEDIKRIEEMAAQESIKVRADVTDGDKQQPISICAFDSCFNDVAPGEGFCDKHKAHSTQASAEASGPVAADDMKRFIAGDIISA